jgi:hypothetical protein
MLLVSRWRRVLPCLVLCLAIALGGCGATPGSPPVATIAAAALPTNWQRIDLPQLALALPPEWAVTAAEDLDLSGAIEEVAAQNPQLQALLERGQVDLASGALQLIAYDLDPASLSAAAYPANLRIGRQSYPQPPALASVSDVNEQDLKSNPSFREVQRAPVELSGHPATRLTSRLQINDSTGNPLDLALEQYLLVEGSDVYIISFTLAEGQQPRYRSIFDQILATLQLKAGQ